MIEMSNLDFADQGIDISASLAAARPVPKQRATDLAFSPPSEDSLALAFTEQYRDTLKFCQSSGRWYAWDGQCWERREGNCAIDLIRTFIRIQTLGLKEYCKASMVRAVETLLRESPDHAVNSSYWDRDIFLLGTPDGVVDLRDGQRLRPDPRRAITKKTRVAPRPGTPKAWLQFLHDATDGDDQMIAYIQRICGYALTGSTQEHAMFFVYGPGGNGKSVFLNTVAGLMGDYARAASMDTFTASKNDRHPTELAMLQGARLVTSSETDEGRAWAEARIKQLTGSDPIPARFMRQDFFEYIPQFKLVILGNHPPQLRTVDEAIKRRFNILPFTHKPAHPDRQLEAKLKAEWPQILNWMIDGCLTWQKHGLVQPQAVKDATADYFDEQDLFGQWLEDCCDVSPSHKERSNVLYFNWVRYAEEHGEAAGTNKAFSYTLKRHGFLPVKSNSFRWRMGLQLRRP